MTRCIVCWTTVHLQHSPTDFTSPSHLRHPKTAMPNRKLKRGGEAEQTPSGRDSARRRTECTTSAARDNGMSPPTPGHVSSRLAVHACNYSVGQRFTMSVGDARAKWLEWVSNGHTRVTWQVVDNTRADDRLTCKYTGRSVANRSLIGNGGVVELVVIATV